MMFRLGCTGPGTGIGEVRCKVQLRVSQISNLPNLKSALQQATEQTGRKERTVLQPDSHTASIQVAYLLC